MNLLHRFSLVGIIHLRDCRKNEVYARMPQPQKKITSCVFVVCVKMAPKKRGGAAAAAGAASQMQKKKKGKRKRDVKDDDDDGENDEAATKKEAEKKKYVVMVMHDDRLCPEKFPLRVFDDFKSAKAFVNRYVDPQGEPNREIYHRNLLSKLYDKPFYSRDGDTYAGYFYRDEDEAEIERVYKEREDKHVEFMKELGLSHDTWITRIGIDACL